MMRGLLVPMLKRTMTRLILLLTLLAFLFCPAVQLAAQQATDTILLTKQELKKEKVYHSISDALKEPEKVIILDLTGQHLDSLPSSVAQFKNLQVLRLGCKIKDTTPKRIIVHSRKIGGGIMHLDRLQGKYIDYNYLKKLPSTIKNLAKLQEINLGYNNILDVPFELAELKNMRFVN